MTNSPVGYSKNYSHTTSPMPVQAAVLSSRSQSLVAGRRLVASSGCMKAVRIQKLQAAHNCLEGRPMDRLLEAVQLAVWLSADIQDIVLVPVVQQVVQGSLRILDRPVVGGKYILLFWVLNCKFIRC